MSIDYIIEKADGVVVSFPERPWMLEAVNLSGHPVTLAHWKDLPPDEQKRLRETHSVLIVRGKGESVLRGEPLHVGPTSEVNDLCSAIFQAISTAGMGMDLGEGEVVRDRLPGDPICVSIPAVLEGLAAKAKEDVS